MAVDCESVTTEPSGRMALMRPVDPEKIPPTMTEPATPDTTPLAS